jgi:Protein of unknown function (DUF2726)
MPTAMDFLDPLSAAALATAGLLMLHLMSVRRRQRSAGARTPRQEALDTVAAWPPEAARVLTVTERESYELLRRAFPGQMVLAQVPLARFMRVPTRHSYSDWMQRAGQLSADLMLCDAGSRVLAVVDIRSDGESARSRRRHERLARVMKAAGIRVHVWREGDLPGVSEVRATISASLMPPEPKASASRPMPLIPVPEIEEILAEGDAMDHTMEPVPSGFYDEQLEPATR